MTFLTIRETLIVYASRVPVLLVILALLTSCANLKTVGRRTSLRSDVSQAIHLDAQQRLVIVQSAHNFCAEPSPDALAAYAASLGFSASVLGREAISLAEAGQSTAGSIGLRTQSITLMRDALYRMCEAYMKGAIGTTQVATLLARSQDLTAVILAVEQLTGAVAANQVILTGTAGAGASASLMTNQKLLDAARQDEAGKKKKLGEAKGKLETAESELEDQRVATKDAQDNLDKANDSEKAKFQEESKIEEEKLDKARKQVEVATTEVKTREELLAESEKVRKTIESTRDSSLTNAIAYTTGSGQFSLPVQRKELSKEATRTIANAVKEMVTAVLRKDYTQDSCMALLTNVQPSLQSLNEEQKETLENIRLHCLKLIDVKLQIDGEKVEEELKALRN